MKTKAETTDAFKTSMRTLVKVILIYVRIISWHMLYKKRLRMAHKMQKKTQMKDLLFTIRLPSKEGSKTTTSSNRYGRHFLSCLYCDVNYWTNGDIFWCVSAIVIEII